MDQVRIGNYLATLKIAPGSANASDDEALGACIGLVHYAMSSNDLRLAWLKALDRTGINSSKPATAVTTSNRQLFYGALLARKNEAFGTGLQPRQVTGDDIVATPWMLPERRFRELDELVKLGKNPVGETTIDWKWLMDKKASIAETMGASTPPFMIGKYFLKKFLERYAPEFAAVLASSELSMAVGAAAFTGLVAYDTKIALDSAQAKRNFPIDRTRRDYDLSMPTAEIATR